MNANKSHHFNHSYTHEIHWMGLHKIFNVFHWEPARVLTCLEIFIFSLDCESLFFVIVVGVAVFCFFFCLWNCFIIVYQQKTLPEMHLAIKIKGMDNNVIYVCVRACVRYLLVRGRYWVYKEIFSQLNLRVIRSFCCCCRFFRCRPTTSSRVVYLTF